MGGFVRGFFSGVQGAVLERGCAYVANNVVKRRGRVLENGVETHRWCGRASKAKSRVSFFFRFPFFHIFFLWALSRQIVATKCGPPGEVISSRGVQFPRNNMVPFTGEWHSVAR